MAKDVVLALSLEDWDDLVRREFCRPPDRGVLALAGDHRVAQLVVMDAWRSWPAAIVKRRGLTSRQVVVAGGRSNVLRLRPRRLRRVDPTDVADLRSSYSRYLGWAGRLPRTGGGTATLVTYNPFVAAFGEAAWVGRRIFVGRDDFASAPRKRPWWPAYQEAYRRIAERCDAIFTVSQVLADRVAPGRAQVLPNGIDAALWTPARPAAAQRYAVYAGTVEGRVDIDLFEEVLRVLPRIVVAGVVVDQEMKARLEAMPGVELRGSLSQQALAGVIAGAVVGLVPHRDTPMTRAMSPLKMYEYLAAGLPVVATDLPPMLEGGSRVWRCTSKQDWAPAVAEATARGRAPEAERLATIRRISWDARLAPLVNAAVS